MKDMILAIAYTGWDDVKSYVKVFVGNKAPSGDEIYEAVKQYFATEQGRTKMREDNFYQNADEVFDAVPEHVWTTMGLEPIQRNGVTLSGNFHIVDLEQDRLMPKELV